ncbi:MAG: membrane protein insertion efficiency factor YidD [Burkholderiales bacterium]|nr:MAG: membrane protein insertion efficiency factor YidD [Burkholderiales bacterium]
MMRGLLIGLVKGYRLLLSPWLGSACRFEPTCSVYSIQALEQHGAAAGTYLTLARLVRCHPWCDGGHDPVPLEKPRLFTHLPLTVTGNAAKPAISSTAPGTASQPLQKKSS